MNFKILRMSSCCIAALFWTTTAAGQQRGTQDRPPSAREAAPIDLTGYWVPIISEDWRWRMLTPPKGDFLGVPLNQAGIKIVDAWDPAKDQRPENLCDAYGAPTLMRLPLRVHITWENENTLKIESDAGRQTRLLHFRETIPSNQPKSLQGYSVASWEVKRARGQKPEGNLKVVTTRLKAGYLRTNGVPYSEDAVLTEYFDRHADYGTEWFTILSIVEDPTYLTEPFIVSSHFKREPDGSKWDPSPCEVNRPAK
jgi:hypothetical protein